MTLTWGEVGSRRYEKGIDRGVLFVDGLDGVAWTGLVSVTNRSSGGEAKPYYLDGVKYSNESEPTDFEAILEAFTYPDEFAECDGTSGSGNGLFFTQQERKTFGLCYRTRIGNDLDGLEHGYKIHLVYNASASASEFAYQTTDDSNDITPFSWAVTTRPEVIPGRMPTSHLVIDSRSTTAQLLTDIENILYGFGDTPARLPSISEIGTTFDLYGVDSYVIDGGTFTEPGVVIFDGGTHISNQTETADGGTP